MTAMITMQRTTTHSPSMRKRQNERGFLSGQHVFWIKMSKLKHENVLLASISASLTHCLVLLTISFPFLKLQAPHTQHLPLCVCGGRRLLFIRKCAHMYVTYVAPGVRLSALTWLLLVQSNMLVTACHSACRGL
ncbi:hypothetical protein ILYODFUR_018936 [Ilyodon furcidens]|uniref:Uncharacterized protein n=1 Tax=Ilyodon furcidens TaxID=33524 RepID=A0ABV0VF71_9TELE